MEVQNLNRILRFEVYAHSNGHSMPQDAIAKQWVLGAIFASLIHVLRFYRLNPNECMPKPLLHGWVYRKV